ncbi:Serine/threonine-protein kinase RIM15 [Nakaseomyces bracarensis]|uniref:non-specific serine/threonine protein kinase n=1 Tax=Nakaseomyces bracarensis TaxID=273131 RepID=A0ABR4NPB7_9SACH
MSSISPLEHRPNEDIDMGDATSTNESNMNQNTCTTGREHASLSDNDTNSQSSSNYEKYLRLATENNQCMILELELNGMIRYITKQAWENLVGTPIPTFIEDLIEGSPQDKNVFKETSDMMLINDNTSYTVTFNTKRIANDDDVRLDDNENDNTITLEACGILIHDSKTGLPSHTMWIVKPYNIDWHANEIDNILPPEFIKKLGFGATIFAEYLKGVECDMILSEGDLPMPRLELCRVCELYIPAWWLETHSYLCISEHKLRSVIQLLHDNLQDRLEMLNKFRDQSSYEISNDDEKSSNISPNIEYKGFPIKAERSEAFLRTVLDELAELCESAISINPSEYHEDSSSSDTQIDKEKDESKLPAKDNFGLLLVPGNKRRELDNPADAESRYQFSPSSKSCIENIQNWTPKLDLSNENIEEEGLSMLVNDTLELIKKKVEAIIRLDNSMTYNLRIKNEVNSYVLQSIKEQIENNKLKFNHSLSIPLQSSDYPVDYKTASSSISRSVISQSDINALSDMQSEQTNYNNEILNPQPRLFTESYLKNDNIPASVLDNESPSENSHDHTTNMRRPISKTINSELYGKDDIDKSGSTSIPENLSLHFPSSNGRSRSLTPKQRIEYTTPLPVASTLIAGLPVTSASSSDNNSGRSSTRVNNPKGIEKQMESSENNSIHHSHSSSGGILLPKLSTSISLTPRRGSPLPSAQPPNHNVNRLCGSINSNNPSLNSEKSPMVSPYSNDSDFMSPDHQSMPSILQTINSPTFNQANISVSTSNVNLSASMSSNQPLSPLLLATSHMKPLVPSIKDYDIIKPISKGAYGSVYLARKKITGDYFAIKVLRKSDMIAKNQVTNVKSERAIMMVQSDKPYVARLFATFQNKDNLFLVMEYLPGGDLAALLKMMGCLPEKWIKQYLCEIIVGVQDMHENGIIHHDLKPDNLLIDVDGHLKLTDFGLSRAGLVKRHRTMPKSITLSGSESRTNIESFSGSQASTPESIALDHRIPNNSSKVRKRSSLKQDILENNLHSVLLTNEYSGASDNEKMKEKIQRSSMDSGHENSFIRRSESQQSFIDVSRSNTPPPFHHPTSTPMKLRANSITYADNNFNINEASNSPSTDLILFNPEDSKQEKRFFGTPDYLAPETIEGTGEDNQCDWWSVGCILFEMVFGYPPFHADTPEEVFRNILNGNIDWPQFKNLEEECEYVAPEIKELIKKFLIKDPSKRLGANGPEEIKEQAYFKDVNWSQVYHETASFVPNVEDPEDTDYFELRGATLEDFGGDDDKNNNEIYRPMSNRLGDIKMNEYEYPPAHKLSVSSVLESISPGGSSKTSQSGLPTSPAIPSHLRDSSRRSSKLNEKQTEFGSFSFRNLSALDKANKDAIIRLKNEHLTETQNRHRRTSSGSLVGYMSDSSGKLRVSKLTGPGTPPVGMVLNKTNMKNDMLGLRSYSPERSISLDATPSSNYTSGIDNRDSYSLGHGNIHSDVESPPAMKFKSPLSPSTPFSTLNTAQTTPTASKITRSRLLSQTNSQRTSSSHRTNSGDLSAEETERLQAVYRLNSIKYRRRSGRKSSNSSELGYRMDVLVCEPIPIHRYRVTKDLESVGCTVVSVGASDELVSRANSGVKFDLIVTALKLPKLGAVDIVKLLKHTNGINSRTPIIAITNYYHEAVAAKVFDDVLEKPIVLDEIRHMIAKYALKKSQDESTIMSDSDEALASQSEC